MKVTLSTALKVIECKLSPFEHTQIMSKWPERSVFISNIIYYTAFLPTTFPRGLEAEKRAVNS